MTFALPPGKNGSNGHNDPRRGGGTNARVAARDVVTMRAESTDQFRQREPTRIGQFIQQQMVGIQPGGKPIRLVLRHLQGGNQLGQRVGSDSIVNLSEDQIGEMAINIYNLAESDAIGLGSSNQKYVVLSYDEESPTQDPSGRCIFEVQTGMKRRDEEEGGYPQCLDSNPPNEQGVLAQVMGQNKDLLNKVLAVVAANSGTAVALQQQVDRLMGRLAEEEMRRFQSLDMVEQARSNEWARKREATLLEADIEGKREMLGLAKMAIPAILRRIGASDPKQRIEADDIQEVNLALKFASDQAVFDKALDALPDQTSKVAFSEWVVFNVERAQKIEEDRAARAAGKEPAPEPRFLPASGANAQGQPQLPSPPTPEQVEQARQAQGVHAKQQYEFWKNQLQAMDAQRTAEAAVAAQGPAPAASAEAATPTETAKAAPAPKKAKAKAQVVVPTAPKPETPEVAAPTEE